MYVDPLLLFSSGQSDHLIFYAYSVSSSQVGNLIFSIIPPQSVSLALCGQKVKSLKIGLFIYDRESEKCQIGIFHSEPATESSQSGNFHSKQYFWWLSNWPPPKPSSFFIAAKRQKGISMNFMNNNTNPIIIGIDHGYGNIKTAHCCFKTGVAAYDKEPTFKSNLLIYEGRYYLIGEEHKEFISDKMTDSDYYILTLAAVARELNIRKLTSARVHLAAGLPLTWVSEQKDSFKAYLLQNDSADFTFKGVDYHVDFVGADIFPQGFSAVADKLREFKGINMLCDIGNGTMNVMYINECRPLAKKCFTEKYGTNQCMLP